jgi:uncharacterized protein YegP (UPF0339 family)
LYVFFYNNKPLNYGHPKFEIFKGQNDHFYFHLKAGNGEIVLASQGYTQKVNCQKGLHSVEENSVNESNFEKKQSKDEKYYFVLHAANKQIIGNSQMYTSSYAPDHGIHSVHDNATQAEVLDLTK